MERPNNRSGRGRGRGSNRRSWRGPRSRGGNNRWGNFSDSIRFNYNRGHEYDRQINQNNNVQPNFRDGKDKEILNNEYGNDQQKHCENKVSFPKFKDDNTSNIYMPRNNNNYKTLQQQQHMEFFKYPPKHYTNKNFTNQKETIQKPIYSKKPIQKQISSSSSDSSSDSDYNAMEKFKKTIKLSKKKEGNKNFPIPKIIKIKEELDSSSSEKDSSKRIKIKEELDSSSSETDSSKIIKINAELDSSSSETDSPSNDEIEYLTSEDTFPEKRINKIQKQENNEEEEVICLGKLHEIENLIDDDTNSNQINSNENDCCILCDKKDHTSFHCQMICKNCGAQYHNLKNCPKPANISMVLQHFLEFCLNQFTIYNPDQRFNFHNDNVQTALISTIAPFSTCNLNNNLSNCTIPNESIDSPK